MNNQVLILTARPGSISNKNRRQLEAKGVVVIECDRPDEIRLIDPSHEIPAGDVMRCALSALALDTSITSKMRDHFVSSLAAAVNRSAP